MSHPALQPIRADLEHDERAAAMRQAQLLAELAGAFGLFGLRITLDQGEQWTGEQSAERAYCADQAGLVFPANDSASAARPSFPELRARGAHLEPRRAMHLIQAIDWLFVGLAAECAARWGAGLSLVEMPVGQLAAFFGSACALKVGLWLTDSYRQSPAHPERGIGGLALGAILGIVAANAFAPDARAAAALAALVPLTAMTLAGLHAALGVWIGAAHRAGLFAENLVLVGANEAARRMVTRAAAHGEARILAIVDDRRARAPAAIADTPVPGDIDDLIAWEGLPYVDRIVVTVTQKAEGRVREIIQKLAVIPNRVDLLLDYDAHSVRGRRVERLTGSPLACVSGCPRRGSRAIVKRAQDLVLGGVLLALLVLPMGAIAAAIKLDSSGPALYRQRRYGYNNRVISVLKFRTLRHQPGAPHKQVRTNDPRITRIGAFLRRTGLDDLPLLFNVLKGDMSLVGPRPHAVGMRTANRELRHITADYAHRHRVKPGIVSWAQVNGAGGALRTFASVRQCVRLDLEYASRASIWLDLRIIWRGALSIGRAAAR